MATVNLGRVKPVWKNTWTASTAYVVDDIVRDGVTSYICINAHTSGASFATGSDWQVMSQGSNVGTGSAGQVLKTNSAGNGTEWGTDVGGKLLQIKTSFSNHQNNVATTSTTYQDGGGAITITPLSSTSKLIVHFSTPSMHVNGSQLKFAIFRDGTNTVDWGTDGIVGRWRIEGGAYGDTKQFPYVVVPSNATTATTFKLRWASVSGEPYWSNASSQAQHYILEVEV